MVWRIVLACIVVIVGGILRGIYNRPGRLLSLLIPAFFIYLSVEIVFSFDIPSSNAYLVVLSIFIALFLCMQGNAAVHSIREKIKNRPIAPEKIFDVMCESCKNMKPGETIIFTVDFDPHTRADEVDDRDYKLTLELNGKLGDGDRAFNLFFYDNKINVSCVDPYNQPPDPFPF